MANPTSPQPSPLVDALGRTPDALPFWSRYSRPLRVTFPAANTRRDVAHGLGAIPTGMLVIWNDAAIQAVMGVAWTPTLAYVQANAANAHATIMFFVSREDPAVA